MLSVKLIEAVLNEQDPEGLISMGAPSDEYSSEAEEIYIRLNRRLDKENDFFVNEDNPKAHELITYISVITFVLYETFGSGTQYNGEEEPTFWISKDFISGRLDRIKIIAKLIYDLSNKNENQET